MTPAGRQRLSQVLLIVMIANIAFMVYLCMTPRTRSQPSIEPPPVTTTTAVKTPITGTEASVLPKPPALADLRAMIPRLKPLHEQIHESGPSDWLANHKEPGQTFEQYLTCDPITLDSQRRILYIQPVGELAGRRKEIVELSAEFMALYFGTECRVLKALPLSLVPEDKRRADRGFGEQILTGVVLDDILMPRLPKDAAAYIAFTASDLFPDPKWNFVFGQAYLYHRVAVWSLARFGDPDKDEDAFRLCLLRTIKTATHETGHMFSINHCILYECNMDGSNHLAESDAKPLWLCPECFAKVVFATGQDPKESLRKQAVFARKHGLTAEAAFYEKSEKAIDGSP
jgi:archaemetzincin